MKQPNILFIMTDQFRWDGLGSVSDWMNTPSLDRLSREGVLFSRCVTNSPECAPARTALATGLYPHNTGVWNNLRGHDLPEGTDTWMKSIQAAGYRTSLFGKTHLHRFQGDMRDREYLMKSYGFDDIHEIAGPRACTEVMSYMTEEWEKRGLLDSFRDDYLDRYQHKPYIVRPSVLPLEMYHDVYIAQKAKAYLSSYADSRPWFCKLSFGGPHEPWDTPEPYASMYDPNAMPKPIARPSLDEAYPHSHLSDMLKDKRNYSPPMSEEEVKQMRANYAGNITLIDDQIGEILDVLEKKGELDHTIVVFTSDHGEMNGDFGLIYKSNFLRSAAQIPLIIRTPETINNASAGSAFDGLVELMDIGPTLVELAGGTMHYQQFGQSLCPILENLELKHREQVLCEYKGEVMLQTDTWKLALNSQGEAYMLYNLHDDPEEQNNRIFDEALRPIRDELKMIILDRIMSSQIIL